MLMLNILVFRPLSGHLNHWIKWNKKNEKFLKHSIPVGCILFQICDEINIPK